MKILITYPPLESEKGIPQLSQNRQFQWTSSGPAEYYICPMVPASAATLLAKNGFDVIWLDGIAQKMTYPKWLEKVENLKPDLIFIETKTPVIKKHWVIVNQLKEKYPDVCVVLAGDHVTAMPGESMDNCAVDFIITGGDYDFLLLNIANHLSDGEKLESGIWYREKVQSSKFRVQSFRKRKKAGVIKSTGKFELNHDLNSLPMIDRGLTNWKKYAYRNSNFFRTPGAYTMFGRDCWWGKCSFCSWTTLFPGRCYRTLAVNKALDEIGSLINDYGVKEIMDDSGTFPVGKWLRDFCRGMISRGYNKEIRVNCNMRFNAGLNEEDYQMMGKAGFRFILFGLESANQRTLDRINKDLKVEQIKPVLRWAKNAGLMPHLTVMVGYPWETEKELNSTLNLVKEIFSEGLADSLQATVVIPYPGTPLFEYCRKNKLLKTMDWGNYDMRMPVMKTKFSDEKLMSAVRDIFSGSIWNKHFIIKTISYLKTLDGIKYVSLQCVKYLGKLWQFNLFSNND